MTHSQLIGELVSALQAVRPSIRGSAYLTHQVDAVLALAAATGTAKTPTAAECGASQSGPQGNAQDTPGEQA